MRPIALTIALAIATLKMSRRNVIVRKLPAVESLGSCTFIATDKTGTLTVNEMTVQKILIPESHDVDVKGEGYGLKGEVVFPENSEAFKKAVEALALSGALCNEGSLVRASDEGEVSGVGDSVDIALLVLAEKLSIKTSSLSENHSKISEIPFEPENKYAATLNKYKDGTLISVKGALETLLPMSSHIMTAEGARPVSDELIKNIEKQAHGLAKEGYRVLAFTSKSEKNGKLKLSPQDLGGMTFLGVVGMMDPLRAEAASAVRSCHEAGIDVAMVTGDHPVTALAISRQLALAETEDQVVTGAELKKISSESEFDSIVKSARVFARVEPQQKLDIVQSLIRLGKFVAVTGDGANDAPALKAAHVGVAMGKAGTDVAKETSDLILTDDNFSSIVSGIEEGRVAYNNIRKVIYLLISTGLAEVYFFP